MYIMKIVNSLSIHPYTHVFMFEITKNNYDKQKQNQKHSTNFVNYANYVYYTKCILLVSSIYDAIIWFHIYAIIYEAYKYTDELYYCFCDISTHTFIYYIMNCIHLIDWLIVSKYAIYKINLIITFVRFVTIIIDIHRLYNEKTRWE